MKRLVINHLIFAALAVAAAFTSCKKDNQIYIVTFSSNGGSEIAAQIIAEGANAAEPKPAPAREGYYFGGWYTDCAMLTNKWNFATQTVTANITLYAKWGKVKLLETVTNIPYKFYEAKHDWYKFEYDGQNRITKISVYFSDENLYYTNTFTYAGDDLVQVLYSNYNGTVETYEFTKSGNIITQKSGVITSTIELDSDGLPVKRGNSNSYVEIFEYQDGNLTGKKDTSTNWEDWEEYAYYYDNEKGALYYCQTPKWYLILHLNDFGIKNNVIGGGRIFRPWTVYTYEYDDTEFPIERTGVFSGKMTSSESIQEFIYIAK